MKLLYKKCLISNKYTKQYFIIFLRKFLILKKSIIFGKGKQCQTKIIQDEKIITNFIIINWFHGN